MKVLVSGGASTIGSNAVRALQQALHFAAYSDVGESMGDPAK
jgi:UDP-glucose 4-epimerase